MQKARRWLYLVGDFETTVYEGQTSTEVWASAVVPLYTEGVEIFHSIDETYNYLTSLKRDIICYYHNLKFDGSFWLHYLLKTKHFKQALIQPDPNSDYVRFKETDEMEQNEIKYSISDRGQWYTITICTGKRVIELRDSLKLLPFSVKKIGKSFGTKHKKLDMEYTGYRYAGCEITDKEKEYIANDVLVVKEALEIMFNEGHKKMTIGSCCLSEYKKTVKLDFTDYDSLYPNLYSIPLPLEYGSDTVGDYIRRSYHGGWCYLVEGKENKIYHNGITADVNSLYPSMMSSQSGNYYPYGEPVRIARGEPKYIGTDEYFFIRFKTRFFIKPGMLPTVQIKGSFLYDGTAWLKTSDIYNKADGKYYGYYTDVDGEVKDTRVEFTMTETDYRLFMEHYDVKDFEYLDYIVFKKEIGLFDTYIDKYKKIKMESKGAKRELAKLFLNNLYGKMASTTNSSFKIVDFNDKGALHFRIVEEHDKLPGYIAVGTAITSYARNFTIRTAQKNFYGADKRGFIYADTDSIHCELQQEELVDVPVHPTEFCNWKLESSWDDAIFVRQKTYIEHVTHEDLQKIDHPYYNVKCAGMPERSKQLFVKSLEGSSPTETDTEEEKEFLATKRTLKDFRIGLEVPDCLKARQIEGGTLLINGTYKMRE